MGHQHPRIFNAVDNPWRLNLKKTTTYNLIALAVLMIGFISPSRADLIEGVPLRGFTDFSYIYDQSNKSNSFQLGDMDIFLAKPIDKKVNFLVELNFQPSDAGVGVDLERSYVQYVENQWLKVSLGRFHTALGYWNETYHHGRYLHTSLTRPVMVRFEDSGGLLPTHTTGLEFRGNGLVSGNNFGYIFNIGNGRGPVKDPPAFEYSYSKSKSLSGVVFYEWDSGLRLGTNAYHSQLPGGFQHNSDGTNNTQLPGPTGDEWIYGAHLVYNNPSIEFLSEYERINHKYSDGNTNTGIDTFYAQLGVHTGLLTPYARFEVNATNAPDAYFNASTGSNNPGLILSLIHI